MGASSFSPSPITTTPRIETLSSTKRMASTAAWSADSFSPRPIQRAAAIAPASVTRTSSRAMLRSGAVRWLKARRFCQLFSIGCVTNQATTTWKRKRTTAIAIPAISAPRVVRAFVATRKPSSRPKTAIVQPTAPSPSARAVITRTNDGAAPYANFSQKTRSFSLRDSSSPSAMAAALHTVGGVDADELQARGDHLLGRAAEREAESFLLALEHAMLVVEAVEVVGDADRVGRNRLRAALHRCVGDDRGELGEALDQLPLLRRKRLRRRSVAARFTCIAQDPRDACVRVLHVVHRVLLRLLRREVDVDLDRLVGAAVDEEPSRRIHADLVEEVVEEDDIPAALRHLRLLTAL